MVNIKIDLPANFLEEEVRSGYKVTAETKKIWAVELDLLVEFQRVCEKYELKYYADGGTLLGAIRHNGFIPWDDDIDVSMPRRDYDILCSVAASEFEDPYFFQTPSSDPDCDYLHAKLRNSRTSAVTVDDLDRKYNQGIWIDIFPLDNVPDGADDLSDFLRQLSGRIEKKNNYSSYIKAYKNKSLQKPIAFIRHYLRHLYTKYVWSKLHPYDALCGEVETFMEKFNTSQTNRFSNLTIFWYAIYKQLFWLKDWYTGERYADFEFLRIPVPIRSEEVLSLQYGDWRRMVQGGECHKPKIFDTEKPYTEYLNHR